MIINYEYGFMYEGLLYGWKHGKLYKLPQTIGKRFYGLLECTLIDIPTLKGYNVGRKKKSMKQLEAMTIFINHKVQKIESKNLPF